MGSLPQGNPVNNEVAARLAAEAYEDLAIYAQIEAVARVERGETTKPLGMLLYRSRTREGETVRLPVWDKVEEIYHFLSDGDWHSRRAIEKGVVGGRYTDAEIAWLLDAGWVEVNESAAGTRYRVADLPVSSTPIADSLRAGWCTYALMRQWPSHYPGARVAIAELLDLYQRRGVTIFERIREFDAASPKLMNALVRRYPMLEELRAEAYRELARSTLRSDT